MRSHGTFWNSAKCPFCGIKRMFTLIPRLTEAWLYRLRPAGLTWSLRPKPEHLIRQRPLHSEGLLGRRGEPQSIRPTWLHSPCGAKTISLTDDAVTVLRVVCVSTSVSIGYALAAG